MLVFHHAPDANRWVRQQTALGLKAGLVPTMGALHEGHFSLIDASRRTCDKTIATIFVNPTQFAPHEDLSRYPRTLESDLDGLRAHRADAVFIPANDEIYPLGFSTYVDPPEVALPWEGQCRPSHFRGVCTVVLKLFHLLPTTHAFFGQKDFQQAATIIAMVRDLGVNMEIVVCPILRDPDRLAMSSRNRYLTPEERIRALAIPRALEQVQHAVANGISDASQLEAIMQLVLAAGPVDQVEYAAIVDPHTLTRVTRIDHPAVAIIAARVGQTRLIDNDRIATQDG